MKKNKKIVSFTSTEEKVSSSYVIEDCFCGVGPWMHRDSLLPYEAEDMLKLMNHFGIRKALIHSNFALDGGYDVMGNEHILEACDKYKRRFIPAFVVRPNPHKGDMQLSDYFALMHKHGIKAVWLAPKGQALWVWLYKDIVAACCKKKIPIFIHRDDITPDSLYNLCDTFPDARIVLAGVSYGEDWWLYPLLRQFKEIRVCTGHFYIPSYNPMRFLEHFPATRLIFGSGLPFFSPGGMIAHVTYADISEKEKELIFYKNMENLLEEAQP